MIFITRVIAYCMRDIIITRVADITHVLRARYISRMKFMRDISRMCFAMEPHLLASLVC